MLVLVDTSIWIDLLSKKPTCKLTETNLERVAICSPILQEILQGISNDSIRYEMKERLLGLPSLSDTLLPDDYIAASELYVLGRKKGYTVRSSIDCLIAALAIKFNVPVWHQDRDFENIAMFTSLRTIRGNHL
jgi:predicted nucleic acid-binding protein